MRYRKVRCLTQVLVTEDSKLAFRWRAFNASTCDFYFEVRQHRVPFFLSLQAHLRIEETLESLARTFLPHLLSRVTLLFYHVIHGLVCAYSMPEIIVFWKTS